MDLYRAQPLTVAAKGMLLSLRWRFDRARIAAVRLHTPEPLRACLDRTLAWLLEKVPAPEIGDYLELGCFNGHTMATAAAALDSAGLGHTRLVGFDSFRGLPAAAAIEDRGVFVPGEWHCRPFITRENLAARGVDLERVELVEGWFPDTLVEATAQRLQLERTSLVFLDWALGSGTAEALRFVAPLLGARAAFVFPYWAKGELDRHGQGQKAALEAFLARHPELVAEIRPGFHDHARVALIERRG